MREPENQHWWRSSTAIYKFRLEYLLGVFRQAG
jgi:hypothetical protein